MQSSFLSNNAVWLATALCVLGAAGIVSAVLVNLDLRRRGVSSGERLAWLGLALLLPGFGLGVYFFIRLLNLFLAPEDSPDTPLWVTRFKRPAGGRAGGAGGASGAGGAPAVGPGSTIPAMDYLRPAPPPAPGGGGGFSLLIIAGPQAGRAIRLERLPAVIGRGSEVGIPLDADQSVSRQHAEIYLRSGALRIRDLNSAHGTTVNGFSIQDKALEAGDRIEVGRSVLQVQPQGGR